MTHPVGFSGRTPTSGHRSALSVGLVIVAFIVLAVAKPWDVVMPQPAVVLAPPPTLGATHGPSLAPSATPVPDIGSGFTLNTPPAAGTPWTVVLWHAVGPQQPLARFRSVVGWAHGYVAVGDDGDGGTPVWTSTDAADWEPLPLATGTTFWPASRILAVAPAGDHVVALTTASDATASSSEPSTPEPTQLMLWTSGDARTWSLVTTRGLVDPLGLAGPVLLAAGHSGLLVAWNEAPSPGAPGVARLAWTLDGAAWHRVAASALPGDFAIADLRAAPGGGYLAGGSLIAGQAPLAALFRSDATGRTWTPVPLPDDPATTSGERTGIVRSLAVGTAGVLAVGDAPSRERWWWSADGRRWSLVAGFAPFGPDECPPAAVGCGAYQDGVLAGDGHRLAAIRAGPAPGAWTSFDGRSWSALTTSGQALFIATAIVLMPGGLIASNGQAAWYGEASAVP